MAPSNFEPVSPLDMTAKSKPPRASGLAIEDFGEKTDVKATTRSLRTNSTASSRSSNPVRKTRFAEATSVLSPATGPGEHQSPFADPKMDAINKGLKPSDVGFGYISDNQPVEQYVTIKTDPNGFAGVPLKSALKTPGTSNRLLNPLSPTFREEQVLEKEEMKTDEQQAKDLKVKTRVRMAKLVLRGVNFSCSLIVLAMLSTVLTIFHATKSIPPRNNLTAWAPKQQVWPQIVVLSISCVSLLFSVIVLIAYCRGGHNRAQKVAVYYTMFGVGWFMFSVVMWLVGAAVLHGSKANGGGVDMWGWSCKDNKRKQLFQDDVHYALVCRLQDWSLVCCVIEVVVEVIVIAIYGIVFYRFWSKNRLRKSMNARDRARTDLYLAQLRTQSAPNTPGFASMNQQTPRTPGFPSQHSIHSPGGKSVEAGFYPYSQPQESARQPSPQFVAVSPQSNSNTTSSPFRLQAPPIRVHGATPKLSASEGFQRHDMSASPPPPPMSPPPEDRVHQHFGAAPGEQTYDAVPIPGAYVPPSQLERSQSPPGQAY
ncbi:hypothetical protein PV11_09643 [Exophiala sideris]|uniref:MARVEL domain-containing protein n=1 Tax=Exophiala sideris TaxID=1016849 RepID=A0A0D1VP89_9EURO|nr:hypothetical protein PV11_09643 [Exophiala sideris]